MKTVDQIINEIIRTEGGYVDHPNDKGGPTMYGITEQVARAYGYKGRMQDLPRSTAYEIYMRRYWLQPMFDKIYARLPNLAIELADTGVNMGPKKAAEFLQRALNVLNKRGTIYADLNVDGDIGKLTLFAIDNFIRTRGAVDAEKVLLRACNSEQVVRYIELAEKTPSQEDFVYGWILNRGAI